MDECKQIAIQDTTANPAPLGLLGFGTTTVLLNLHNAGIFELNAMILAMGIFYGGVGQIIAGIMEWKKKNTFGTTAFTSYGLFWLTLVGLLVMPKLGWAEKASSGAMAAYLVLWGLFTLGMFIATFKLSRALQVVFATLTVPLLPARRRRHHRQRGPQDVRRLGGHRLRPFGHLYGHRADP